MSHNVTLFIYNYILDYPPILLHNICMEKGMLIQNGVHLREHEYDTVKYLLNAGFNVELIPERQIKGITNPDIQIDGVVWEMKSPTGDSKNTMKHTLQNANHQSRSVIIDLRRCKLQDEKAIKDLEHHFTLSKRLRNMKIITHDENMLDYRK